MIGFPDVPAVEGGPRPRTQVHLPSVFDLVDSTLIGLGEALDAVFGSESGLRHLKKLAPHPDLVDERHLFLWIDPIDPIDPLDPLDPDTPVPFSVADGLASGTTLPDGRPDLSPEITHRRGHPHHRRPYPTPPGAPLAEGSAPTLMTGATEG